MGSDLSTDRIDAEDASGLDRAATALVDRIVALGLDGAGRLDSATAVADAARSRRGGDVEAAIDDVVRRHARLAAAGGFLTGVGGVVTLPVALPANIAGFYILATRMAGAVAALRGYDLSRPEVRSAVALLLIGADASTVLDKVGTSAGGKVRNLALGKLPAPALMMVNKGVGFQLMSQLAAKGVTRLGRGVPLLGGFLGAGVDTVLSRRIGRDARREFPAR